MTAYFEWRVSNFDFIIMTPSHLHGTVTDSRKLILSRSWKKILTPCLDKILRHFKGLWYSWSQSQWPITIDDPDFTSILDHVWLCITLYIKLEDLHMVTFGHIGMRQNRDFRTSRAATLTLMKSLTIMLFIIIKEITLKAARYIHALFWVVQICLINRIFSYWQLDMKLYLKKSAKILTMEVKTVKTKKNKESGQKLLKNRVSTLSSFKSGLEWI